MQTVVMSFGRNQSLGKPDLPIHHLHVYFPVQLVHKLFERMTTDLRFTAAASEEGKEYKHNSESETNSPYIVVGTYESECRPNNPEGADLPDTPSLACAYVQGLLDGNLGQIVSFQSTYKSTLRIEVPVWPDVRQAVLSPVQAQPQPSFSGTISQVTTQRDQHRGVPLPQANTPAEHYSAQREEEEADEVEEDKYVVPDGQGCFSFTQSLLLRAKDTYAARSTGNKYEIISQWLLTGLAVVLSRPSWQLLAKKGTLTATSQEQLQLYYERGYPAGLKDKVALPYALPRHNAIAEAEWQRRVGLFSHSQYSHDMEVLYAERAGSSFAAFYNTMDFTNPIKAETYNRTEAVQQHNEQTEQTEQFEQTEVAQQAKGNNPH